MVAVISISFENRTYILFITQETSVIIVASGEARTIFTMGPNIKKK